MIEDNDIFLFGLQNPRTGTFYKKDSSGIIQDVMPGAGVDIFLYKCVYGWMDTELGFAVNSTYLGLSRSFGFPLKFGGEALEIIREKFYKGVGTETPMQLVVFKYNQQPKTGEPTYLEYYKGMLDFPKIIDTLAETVEISLMEGGVVQMLKNYEDTILEIPCDGSLPENVKILADGYLVNNVAYFSIPATSGTLTRVSSLGCVFLNNEGDSYGVVISDQSAVDLTKGTIFDNPNTPHVIVINRKTTVQIKGEITITDSSSALNNFGLIAFTSISKISGEEPTTAPANAISLVPNNGRFDTPDNIYTNSPKNTPTTFLFNAYIDLQAGEQLTIGYIKPSNYRNNISSTNILSGNFSLTYDTQAQDTRVWGIPLPDMFSLIISNLNKLSAGFFMPFNYGAVSTLLEKYRNVILTSGDAARASGDSRYQRFYNAINIMPGSDAINIYNSYGPVIKTTLKDFFQFVSFEYCAALGSIGQVGAPDALYIESLDGEYNSDVVLMDLGEVADMKTAFGEKLAASDVKIGYIPAQYDQKAGKYEWNTTLAMKAPILSFKNEITKITKYRTDVYGFERLRSNIGAPTSITSNDNDNSVFAIDCDLFKQSYDYFLASFKALTSANNQNYITGSDSSPISLPITNGEYFQQNTDNAILIFLENGLAANMDININVTSGIVDSVNPVPGNPADSCTFKVWFNGRTIIEKTITVTSISTSVIFSETYNQYITDRDTLYVTISTTATAKVSNALIELNIGTGPTYYAKVATPPIIEVLPGSNKRFVSFSNFSPTGKLGHGYQYYVYNSITASGGQFKIDLNVKGQVQGNPAGFFLIDMYVNGMPGVAPGIQVSGTTALSNFDKSFHLDYDFQLGDFVVLTGTSIGLNANISEAQMLFTSKSVKAFGLNRPAYDSIMGIPNLVTDSTGKVLYTEAGCPYNISFSPKRMYKRWERYWKSLLPDKVTGNTKNHGLSKNPYLKTVLGDEVISENSDEDTMNADRYFYNLIHTFKTKVPLTFKQILDQAKGAHIRWTFNGVEFFGFVQQVKQKPALNESQEWQVLCSPKTDLNNLIKINIDGTKESDMKNNTLRYSFLNPIQCVPMGVVLPPKYHTYDKDKFWFREQITRWVNQTDYFNPVQIGDPIPMQFRTRGLAPVAVTVYRCDGSVFIASSNLNVVTSPGVVDPIVLWQKTLDTTSWSEGIYYYTVVAGTGSATATFISEGLDVRTDWPDTILIEGNSSKNTQGTFFDGDEPFILSFRIPGMYDNRFKQKYKGAFFIDQPQDITVLDAIPYETATFWIGPVPDYASRKSLRMILLDNITADGKAVSINEGAEMEEIIEEGAPMKFHKVEIRPKDNEFGISVIANGADDSAVFIGTFSAAALGPNDDNTSGTTDSDLIGLYTTI